MMTTVPIFAFAARKSPTVSEASAPAAKAHAARCAACGSEKVGAHPASAEESACPPESTAFVSVEELLHAKRAQAALQIQKTARGLCMEAIVAGVWGIASSTDVT